ncbi:hypothetical protein P4S52_03160 [Vibrio sp. SA48]
MKWVSLLLVCFSTQVFAHERVLTLRLPTLQDNGHAYYHELLIEALKADGINANVVATEKSIPQKRITKMVENNQLSVMWLLQTKDRDAQYPSVNVPLTNGLIGQRILLIPPQLQSTFEQIHTLNDLQRSGLTAGLGISWYDVDVWRVNNLHVYEQDGEWRGLYRKLSVEGPIHYFPRGMNEISYEAESYPYLAIEQRLILQYQRDFIFYLSQDTKPYKPIIERALIKARSSGLMNKLIDKHWRHSLDALHPENRTIIPLRLPE